MTKGIFGSWENPNIVYIGSASRPVSDEIFDRLGRRGWKISFITDNIKHGFQALYKNQGSVLFVGDSFDLPAVVTLRNQVADTVAILTPTIVACSQENALDKAFIKEFGKPAIIDYPINPSAFIDSLEWLLRRWNHGNLKKLFLTKKLLTHNHPVEAAKILTQLIGIHEIIPMAVPCLCLLIQKQTDLRSVEKVLLNALHEHPRNLGIIIAIVDFYLNSAMPETALKIIDATRKNHGNLRMITPEQIQAHLMLNQIESCIPLLDSMVTSDFMSQTSKDFLMRCLYAEGYVDRFSDFAIENNISIEEFDKSWSKASYEKSA